MFNAALVGLSKKTTNDVVGFMGWLLGNGNIISQTPAGLSYGSEVVGRLWGTTRVLANAALAVVTVWGGVNLMIRATLTSPVFVRATLGRAAAPRKVGAVCGGPESSRHLEQ